MPLWIVIYIAGNLVGTVGPMPYELEECRTRTSEFLGKLRDDVVIDGGFNMKEIDFKCEYHYERPKSRNGEK